MMGTMSNKNRQGFIIVISLILLLVMTAMGVGMYVSVKKSAEAVGQTENRSDALYAAESCVDEAAVWLVDQKESVATPCSEFALGDVCHTIGNRNMDRSLWGITSTDINSTKKKTKLQNTFYKCEVSRKLTTARTVEGGGADVKGEEKYDDSDDLADVDLEPISYYTIKAVACKAKTAACLTGSGLKRSIEVVVKLF